MKTEPLHGCPSTKRAKPFVLPLPDQFIKKNRSLNHLHLAVVLGKLMPGRGRLGLGREDSLNLGWIVVFRIFPGHLQF